MRMQDARAQFAAAGLDTLDAVRDLPADKEAALVESLKLQLGPKKVTIADASPINGIAY